MNGYAFVLMSTNKRKKMENNIHHVPAPPPPTPPKMSSSVFEDVLSDCTKFSTFACSFTTLFYSRLYTTRFVFFYGL